MGRGGVERPGARLDVGVEEVEAEGEGGDEDRNGAGARRRRRSRSGWTSVRFT